MRIGILTYYGVHNHGAVLQAYGLMSVLQTMGHKVQFLSFERSYEYISSEQTKKYKIGLSSIPFYAKYLLQKGLGNILFNIQKRNVLNDFRKKYFDLSESYKDFSGDFVIIGSDEVFSIQIGYNPFMYGYELKPQNIISYAGSFGPTTLDEIDQKRKTQEIKDGFVKNFKAISVRDLNSQNIIQALCDKEAKLVCDPVILYGYHNEMNQFVPQGKDYLVVYAYDNRMNDPVEVQSIKEYAKKHHLKIYSVGFYHDWCDKCIPAGPIELLGWIKHARLVVTDTFHGSVLSIICNTPMSVKLRDNSNKLEYLLHEYGLQNRIMKSFTDLEKVADTPLDFSECNRKLSIKRQDSLDFLQNALGE